MSAPFLLPSLRWRRAFSQGAYQRGMEYAFDDRVTQLQALDANGLHWRAQVQGGHAKPYEVEVQVRASSGRAAPTVISRCSCPMQSLCKHAAAVLHTVELDQEDADLAPEATRIAPAAPLAPPRDPLLAWNQWLKQLRAAAPPAAPAAAEVGLLLRSSPYYEPPLLLVGMASFARGKKGGLTDARGIEAMHGLAATAPAGGWPAEDLMPLHLLLAEQLERVGQVHYAALRGAALERAFEHLLQRYPAYYERASRPLQRGPVRRLVLRWEDLPDASQRLRYVPEDGAELRLLQGHSLWYIDEQRGLLGRIEGDARLLDAMRGAPVLAPTQVDALRARLQQGDVALPIPAPTERPIARRIAATPRGVLELERFQPDRSTYGGRDQTEPVGVARLSFEYAGLRVALPFAQHETRLLDGDVVELSRDATQEHALAQQAQALGLVLPTQLPWPLSYSYSRLDPQQLLLAPDANRQPRPPQAWHALLRTLASDGWRLEYAADFPRPLREIEAGEWDAELSEEGSTWFALALGIDVEGQRVDLLPILRGVLSDPAFPLRARKGEPADARWRVVLDDERALLLPVARLRALLAPLLDWLQQDGAVRLHRSQGDTLQSLATHVRWRGDARLRQRLVDLRAQRPAITAPKGFRAKLRPYQREGLGWLEFLAEAGLGGVLADDMGLGKTVQVLAHVLAQRQRATDTFRVLVVAPTSLMGNWRDEAARFAPDLKTLVLHGPDRGDRYDDIAAHDLILTTYPLLPRDRERLLQHEFDLLVVDEAQAIKNAKSQAAQVVRELRAARRLAMTGTPLENHLGELWAQFDAVEPGLLGSERDFTRLYRTPIEKHGDRERQQRLHRRIGALLLRRRKDEVLKDLPPKTEIVRMLDLEGAQRELYETLRLAQHQRVREAIAERGLAQSGIVVLDALLKLRQACCDPRLVKLPAARRVQGSVKLEALRELLQTLLAEGRRVLLFSQFTGMLDLIEPTLHEHDIAFLRLDGDTPGAARAGLVRRFQAGEVGLFLISLKAGGVGLNLTAADTVIHFDPWWNPAVERQATDRAHRIGQNKPVFVYKLICSGTVEEKILALQTRKADLAQAVLEGGRSTKLRFDEADLAELFAPMR